jgi:hypothetical protein
MSCAYSAGCVAGFGACRGAAPARRRDGRGRRRIDIAHGRALSALQRDALAEQLLRGFAHLGEEIELHGTP